MPTSRSSWVGLVDCLLWNWVTLLGSYVAWFGATPEHCDHDAVETGFGLFLHRDAMFLSQQAINWVGFKRGFFLGARSNLGSVPLSLAALCLGCPSHMCVTQGSVQDPELGAPPLRMSPEISLFPVALLPQMPASSATCGSAGGLAELWPDPDLLLGLKTKKLKITPAAPVSTPHTPPEPACSSPCPRFVFYFVQGLDVGSAGAYSTMEAETSLRFWHDILLKLKIKFGRMPFLNIDPRPGWAAQGVRASFWYTKVAGLISGQGTYQKQPMHASLSGTISWCLSLSQNKKQRNPP